jgi:hypothetical protein
MSAKTIKKISQKDAKKNKGGAGICPARTYMQVDSGHIYCIDRNTGKVVKVI